MTPQLLADPAGLAAERLARRGVLATIRQFATGTHLASDAAAAAGTHPDKIAKTVVFRGDLGPVLAVVAGDRRVHRRSLERAARQRIEPAPGTYLIEALGVVPGGATPLIAPPTACVVVDAELARAGVVWVAAGTPDTIVAIDAARLADLGAGTVAPIATPRPAP
ncbi:YbaK/prolyl-tRNA synthetase associated region [Acidimicrobium ferrooxidans DSM 10331]|uniref:YbaK/prolyl-tRNA synthetase associated region n=1 Tax=Acidimicrobium ferrooxidans (strain DSM 10331 / JCM 15462 / NBRC 103882 / ICP) TaxID=525909 RepID=C7M358_ACIFD|nr:YbaK/EbsC family protein [Acidimicrobium ferrooxidans]ACU53452.1 YbaK/prolyl-tRNA synthetase associated region [Acidimicrobium ferrooxidans DSM 10331]